MDALRGGHRNFFLGAFVSPAAAMSRDAAPSAGYARYERRGAAPSNAPLIYRPIAERGEFGYDAYGGVRVDLGIFLRAAKGLGLTIITLQSQPRRYFSRGYKMLPATRLASNVVSVRRGNSWCGNIRFCKFANYKAAPELTWPGEETSSCDTGVAPCAAPSWDAARAPPHKAGCRRARKRMLAPGTPTRAGMLFCARCDGQIDAWDRADSSFAPVMVLQTLPADRQGCAGSRRTVLSPKRSNTKTTCLGRWGKLP